jgi:hypothetical protein
MWILTIFCKSLQGKFVVTSAFVEIHFISTYISVSVNERVSPNGFDL